MVQMRKTLALAVIATALALSTDVAAADSKTVAMHPHAHHHKTHQQVVHHHHKAHHKSHHKPAPPTTQPPVEEYDSEDSGEYEDSSEYDSGSADSEDSGSSDSEDSKEYDDKWNPAHATPGPVEEYGSLDGSGYIDVDGSGDYEFDSSASLDSDDIYELDGSLDDGSVDVEYSDSEDYDQSLDLSDDQTLDESIDLPQGAKKVHLRVHKGQVELDIIKESPAQKKEPVAAETPKKEAAAAPTTVEKVETLAKEGIQWVESNSSKPAFLAGAIGAAVVMVGVAGVAIAKSRKRSAPTSVLDVEAAEENAQAATEEQDEVADENESSSDEESADEAEDVEEKKEAAGVVEGSV